MRPTRSQILASSSPLLRRSPRLLVTDRGARRRQFGSIITDAICIFGLVIRVRETFRPHSGSCAMFARKVRRRDPARRRRPPDGRFLDLGIRVSGAVVNQWLVTRRDRIWQVGFGVREAWYMGTLLARHRRSVLARRRWLRPSFSVVCLIRRPGPSVLDGARR